ncbi:transaldolase [Pricia sp. S334]|uniref:Transaldolase n=1 Tax=Pricia mediterranea TaxID=3076079 RepID=A0ABU3L1K6_9FLAO|nr:transaldolase [Pricia sp. S334]MDT7827614.1 transaldolase [Pricia sp. S334]
MNPLLEILQQGQSIWLDLLDRNMMDSGKLQSLIDDDGLRGVTSNPAIFEKAISNSSDYDDDLAKISEGKEDNEAIFFELAVKDIQRAADFFEPIYKETEGQDGFVSLEVSPFLARDTQGTVEQARELWNKVDRKNVMIKIPGTKEGLPAIRQCIGEGININVTLLFGLPRYKEVTDAYLSGLEDRLNDGKPIGGVASVASFFLSRIDVMVDPMLEAKGLDDLKGEVAIASAKKAYQIYKDVFSSDRFKNLEERSAKPQRVLWASTSTKDPSFSDVKYVEALIGPETVNTLPMDTLDAFRDHGKVANRLTENMEHADKIMQRLKENDIDIDKITQNLVDEGIEKFNKPFNKLLDGIETQKSKMA